MKEKILEAFENLGFNLQDNGELGYTFSYEGLNLILYYDDETSDYLNICVPDIYSLEVDEKELYEALKEKINSTIRYVKTYTINDSLWLFYERELLGNEDLEELLRRMIQQLVATMLFAIEAVEKMESGESDEDFDDDDDD